MITNYVSINTVIEQLNREYIPGTHWNIEELKEWTYEALNKIDRRLSNIKATDEIEIQDGKAKIPSEVELIDKIYRIHDDGSYEEILELLPNRDLTITFYIINQGYIHVKFESGQLLLHYLTTPVDLEGNPMIPDNVYYKSAVLAFLQYKIGRRAYWAGKILQNQLIMLEQEWYFYNNAAKGQQRMNAMRNSKRFRKLSNRFRL